MKNFLLEHYLWLKSFHLIFVIAWMAGMMYLPRLFVNHHQSKPGGEAEQYFIQMERRLLKGIINPSMIMVWVLGLAMVWANWSGVGTEGWFHLKFAFAFLISGIHGYYAGAYKKFSSGQRPQSEKFWRILNEVPFLLMIGIVLLVIFKPF